MAASFLASTAILLALTLLNIVPTAGHPTAAAMQLFSFMGKRIESLHQVKLLLLSVDFFFAFFNFTMAIRYYNHLGFMINAPRCGFLGTCLGGRNNPVRRGTIPWECKATTCPCP